MKYFIWIDSISRGLGLNYISDLLGPNKGFTYQKFDLGPKNLEMKKPAQNDIEWSCDHLSILWISKKSLDYELSFSPKALVMSFNANEVINSRV